MPSETFSSARALSLPSRLGLVDYPTAHATHQWGVAPW
jgi:hypothetical protein